MRTLGPLLVAVLLTACPDDPAPSEQDATPDATTRPDATGGDVDPETGADTGTTADVVANDASEVSSSDTNGPDSSGGSPPLVNVPTDSLFAVLPPTGAVEVTLHPSEIATVTGATPVSFGVPFPRGVVDDVSQVRLVFGTQELPSHIEETARWRSLQGDQTPTSVRAATVWTTLGFPNTEPVVVRIEYGVSRSRELGDQGDAWSTWVSAIEGPLPDEYAASEAVMEPMVYATFPPEWLSACLLRTRSLATGDATWQQLDSFLVGGSGTAINDVDPQVTDLIDVSGSEPWLFDRAMTLWGTYVRTGDVKWLRHAHRASYVYANHIGADGYFDLKPGDLKYAYGQAMFVDLMLTGDTRHLPRIEQVASAGESWNEAYTFGTNFWTERHQTYALLAALSAWEATGATVHRDRVVAIATATIDLATTPANGWTAEGCVLHTLNAHEGGGGDDPICSPWMSALLADAMWRYWLHSDDDGALGFLQGLAEFVATTGTYDGTADGVPYTLPYYLVSSATSQGDAWADQEHTCDVAGLVARGAWAAQQLGGSDISAMTAAAAALIDGCNYVLDYWHRPNGPASGKSEWRLSPARKFSWWFGTTTDLTWFAEQLGL